MYSSVTLIENVTMFLIQVAIKNFPGGHSTPLPYAVSAVYR